MWTHLERQAVGGVGLRGPGETQLETDRRLARARIAQLKGELADVHRHRELYRRRRRRHQQPVVAIVGYTNAGKSTLLNRLTDAGVRSEDQLFATLDPTTRRITLPSGRETLITDTVGFINHLPTMLIAAFRATLEEIREATVLLHVLDIAHPQAPEQAETVREVLAELEVSGKPIVTALNKIDLLENSPSAEVVTDDLGLPDDFVPISAATGAGLEQLLQRLDDTIAESIGLRPLSVVIPYDRSELVNLFHRSGTVETESHGEAGTLLTGLLPRRLWPRFEPFVAGAQSPSPNGASPKG
jgi:GTP-binding protein HflX